jgi:hypothetical protein
MKTEDFSQIEQRVRRYWYTDGLGELIGGGMFILLGIYFALQSFLGENSIFSDVLQASLVIVLIGGFFAGRRLINYFKSRLTYPRTGFVEYRVNLRDSGRRRTMVIILSAAIAALLITIEKLIDSSDWMTAATGLLVALILFLNQGRASRLQRFYILGLISIIVGTALSLSQLSTGYALGLYYGLLGLAFITSGSVVLRHYLQGNPVPMDSVHER